MNIYKNKITENKQSKNSKKNNHLSNEVLLSGNLFFGALIEGSIWALIYIPMQVDILCSFSFFDRQRAENVIEVFKKSTKKPKKGPK